MSRGAVVGILALLLAGALPAQGQQWVGKRLCAPQSLSPGAEFGSAVAVADDGTIAVGDYRHDVVYLFRRNAAGGCEQFAEIRSPSPNAWFGFALAIGRDGKVLLVGAPKSGGTGAAYRVEVPNGVAGAPQQISELTPTPASGDEVGSSVAIAGNNQAIGARGADGRRGRVYFSSGGPFAAVEVAGLAPNAELGQSVALSGTTLVMGAPSPYRGSGSPGSAWIFDLASRTLLPPLVPHGGLEPEAAFGYAVAVDGGRILIGAPLADRNGTDSGVVFDFRREDGSWVSQPLRVGERGDQLGVAVALDIETAVIGARYAKDTRGAAYLKKGSSETLELEPATSTGALFGAAVAVRGDTAVVGAFREKPGGAAYRFDAPPVDAPSVTVEFVAASSDVLESAGTILLSMTVHGSSGRLKESVTVDLKVLGGGTATEGRDFDFSSAEEPSNIPAGTRLPYTLTKVVAIKSDEIPEAPETFQVQLSADPPPQAGALIVHTVTIHQSVLMVSAGPLQTSEPGGSASLQIRLAVQPSAGVEVFLRTRNPGEGTVPPGSLHFDSQNWENGSVQVTGQDDELCDGSQSYEILATTASADPRYKDLSLIIPAENADDELACLSASERKVCTDDGGTVVYTVSLVNSVSGVPDTPALFRDTLPSGVSVVTASADRGTATADPIANSVRWTVPVPAGGEAATITIVAALDEPSGSILENLTTLTYDRDGRGHRETIEIDFFEEEDVSCPP